MPSVRCLGFVVLLASAAPAGAVELFAGDYSFSDELGGFTLLSATGTGTRKDPIVIVEEVTGPGPIVLLVRRRMPEDPPRYGYNSEQLTLVKEIVNRTGRVWQAFEIELREILDKPSPRSDGLSFNQAGAHATDVGSDMFYVIDRKFEPYDGLSFREGAVDPGDGGRFRLTITDPTPVPEFYVLQDPKLLTAGIPGLQRRFAETATPAASIQAE